MTVLRSTPTPTPAHPLARLVEDLETLLDDTGHGNAWTLTPAELAALLPRLTRAKARLVEVELRVLREADRQAVGDAVGAANTPAWWAHATGQPVPAARAAATLAQALDHDGHEPTREALAAGRVQVEQARAVIDAIQALPTDLDRSLVADAEQHLVGLADLDGQTRLDPKALRIAGRKLLEVIAPEIAEAHQQRLLEAEEHHAAATATLTLRRDGHGSLLGSFKIPELAGAILTKHLNAIAAPKHQRATRRANTSTNHDTDTDPAEGSVSPVSPVSPVSRPLRLGAAFVEYLETRDAAADGSPKAGGIAATVVVTITLEQLLGGLPGRPGSEKAATLDTGELLSAATARRLACEAGSRGAESACVAGPRRDRRQGTSRPPPLRSSGAFEPSRLHPLRG